MEDSIINFALHRIAKSLKNLKRIGYYYIRNSESITNNFEKIIKIKIHYGFIFLKMIFEFSKNVKYEKDMANLIFTNLIKRFDFFHLLSSPNKDFYFYYNIIKVYINSKYISDENKIVLNAFKDKIKAHLDKYLFK